MNPVGPILIIAIVIASSSCQSTQLTEKRQELKALGEKVERQILYEFFPPADKLLMDPLISTGSGVRGPESYEIGEGLFLTGNVHYRGELDSEISVEELILNPTAFVKPHPRDVFTELAIEKGPRKSDLLSRDYLSSCIGVSGPKVAELDELEMGSEKVAIK